MMSSGYGQVDAEIHRLRNRDSNPGDLTGQIWSDGTYFRMRTLF